MVIVYSKNNCSACESAKALLTSKGIKYAVKNCDVDYDSYDFIVSKGHRSFPQIYNEDGTIFVEGGFVGLKEKLK